MPTPLRGCGSLETRALHWLNHRCATRCSLSAGTLWRRLARTSVGCCTSSSLAPPLPASLRPRLRLSVPSWLASCYGGRQLCRLLYLHLLSISFCHSAGTRPHLAPLCLETALARLILCQQLLDSLATGFCVSPARPHVADRDNILAPWASWCESVVNKVTPL